MPVLTALMVGAFLAPTDPVLASDIVVSERAERDIPAPVRHLLTGESGANDGMGQVMLMAPILFMAGTAVTALSRLVVDEILWGVVAAAIIGVAMGDLAGRLMVWVRSRSGHNAGSTITVGIALSVSVLSAVQLIGSGSILAVFAAGLRFKRYVAAEETSHPATQASAARFFTLPFFLVPGAELPVADWIRMAPATIGAVVLVVLLRRLPWWLMLRPWLGHRCRWRDTAFPGWFGPIGTAAIYYALWAEDRTGIDYWAVATLAVTLSAALHGVTATPLTNGSSAAPGASPSDDADIQCAKKPDAVMADEGRLAERREPSPAGAVSAAPMLCSTGSCRWPPMTARTRMPPTRTRGAAARAARSRRMSWTSGSSRSTLRATVGSTGTRSPSPR